MWKCKYCGKPTGFLRNKHPECEAAHQKQKSDISEGTKLIFAAVCRVITGNEGFTALEKEILQIESKFLTPRSARKTILINGWEASVEKFLEDDFLDEKEEKRLSEFKNHFALSQSELNRNGVLLKAVKAAVLREVLNGSIPQRITLDADIHVNFQKNEQVIWAFPNSDYLEDTSRRHYVGASQGLSFRVMKGVYYRVGAFKGNPVEHTERIHVDNGWVLITNKNIYFAGSSKSLRVPYSKVISFIPFSNGFGILRDTATAKPQIFVTNDGWFSYNLVTNLAQQ